MGIRWSDGYSAYVESYLVVGKNQYALAKTNGVTLTLAEDCELDPGSIVEMRISVDGQTATKIVCLPKGVRLGERRVPYSVAAPF